jgi:hypothetical protein
MSTKVAGAREVVPWLMYLIGWSFDTYLQLKGLNRIWTVPAQTANVASEMGLPVSSAGKKTKPY